MIEEQIKKEFSVDIIDRTEQANPKLIKRLNKLQKTKGCQWSPIEFDVTGSLTYLLSRSAAEFASLVSSKKEYTILLSLNFRWEYSEPSSKQTQTTSPELSSTSAQVSVPGSGLAGRSSGTSRRPSWWTGPNI